ncbi:MAG TPA: hypothetical protein VHW66_19140 [Stellaceae bacterium]|nr:hypothetical protein [Stellaceae bacterium]
MPDTVTAEYALPEFLRPVTTGKLKPIYSFLIACGLRRFVNGERGPEEFSGATADEHQSNGAWGIHQLRLRLPFDDQDYRVIIAPANAPITVGGIPVDQHFSYPLGALPAVTDDAP